MRRPTTPIRTLLMTTAALCCAAAANGQILSEELPAEIRDVGITEHLDEKLPLDLQFLDENGRHVTLQDYFDDDDTPVILTFNFYRCAHLCTLTLNGLVDAMGRLKWTAGQEFRVVTVSIADEEGPVLAMAKKRSYMSMYGRDDSNNGWSFLTGDRASIDTLADAAGFGFTKVETEGSDYDYAHSSSIIFVTPDGRLSRYMNDVQFQPRDIRLALVEASEGSIGSPMERFLLFTCYRYDHDSNSYGASAVKLMRLTGAMTLLALMGGVGVLWLRGSRHHEVGDHTDSIDQGGYQS